MKPSELIENIKYGTLFLGLVFLLGTGAIDLFIPFDENSLWLIPASIGIILWGVITFVLLIAAFMGLGQLYKWAIEKADEEWENSQKP